jgi:competence protein ComFB
MKLAERYDLENLRNISAEKVLKRVEKLLYERSDFCHCEDCVLDLIAYTLNHVTPMYGTSLLGPLHPNREREKKIEVEIDLAIREGLKRIKQHPHHEKNTGGSVK